MKSIKQIEKEFDEKFIIEDCTHTKLEECICPDLSTYPEQIKSFYRQQIKELLEELRIKKKKEHFWVVDWNNKNMEYLREGWNGAVAKINSKIDKIIKDL